MTFELGDTVKRVYSREYKEKWGFIPGVVEETGIGEIYTEPSDYAVNVIWEDWSVSSEFPEHLRLVERIV